MDGLNAPIYGMFRNPRNGCGSENPFDTGLGYSSAKGYRYKTPQTRNGSGGRKGFSLKDFVRETLIGGVTGGLASAAFYGVGKAAEKRKLNRCSVDSFDKDIKLALVKLDKSGLRPGQTRISKSRIRYLVENYDPILAHSCVYTDSTGKYLVEGHHTTVANTILNRGSGLNMNLISPGPPETKEIYWTKKWYEFWKNSIMVKE